eukprot:Gregarina_sp_Poly_1__11359@NODE_958_length_5551_cov_23_957695_g678_i0_p1_GENE_NODE_958_length_5551_cov_23_957695_g678_i0NODE_958_length_5551_cov_23_957695_g678_i0_p1_ORF_typecomplete_len1522_score208_60Chorein_N/PF12624_7/0_36_NODE_958_length_5551_cov_23_957695_g678_i0284593
MDSEVTTRHGDRFLVSPWQMLRESLTKALQKVTLLKYFLNLKERFSFTGLFQGVVISNVSINLTQVNRDLEVLWYAAQADSYKSEGTNSHQRLFQTCPFRLKYGSIRKTQIDLSLTRGSTCISLNGIELIFSFNPRPQDLYDGRRQRSIFHAEEYEQLKFRLNKIKDYCHDYFVRHPHLFGTRYLQAKGGDSGISSREEMSQPTAAPTTGSSLNRTSFIQRFIAGWMRYDPSIVFRANDIHIVLEDRDLRSFGLWGLHLDKLVIRPKAQKSRRRVGSPVTAIESTFGTFRRTQSLTQSIMASLHPDRMLTQRRLHFRMQANNVCFYWRSDVPRPAVSMREEEIALRLAYAASGNSLVVDVAPFLYSHLAETRPETLLPRPTSLTTPVVARCSSFQVDLAVILSKSQDDDAQKWLMLEPTNTPIEEEPVMVENLHFKWDFPEGIEFNLTQTILSSMLFLQKRYNRAKVACRLRAWIVGTSETEHDEAVRKRKRHATLWQTSRVFTRSNNRHKGSERQLLYGAHKNVMGYFKYLVALGAISEYENMRQEDTSAIVSPKAVVYALYNGMKLRFIHDEEQKAILKDFHPLGFGEQANKSAGDIIRRAALNLNHAIERFMSVADFKSDTSDGLQSGAQKTSNPESSNVQSISSFAAEHHLPFFFKLPADVLISWAHSKEPLRNEVGRLLEILLAFPDWWSIAQAIILAFLEVEESMHIITSTVTTRVYSKDENVLGHRQIAKMILSRPVSLTNTPIAPVQVSLVDGYAPNAIYHLWKRAISVVTPNQQQGYELIKSPEVRQLLIAHLCDFLELPTKALTVASRPASGAYWMLRKGRNSSSALKYKIDRLLVFNKHLFRNAVLGSLRKSQAWPFPMLVVSPVDLDCGKVKHLTREQFFPGVFRWSHTPTQTAEPLSPTTPRLNFVPKASEIQLARKSSMPDSLLMAAKRNEIVAEQSFVSRVRRRASQSSGSRQRRNSIYSVNRAYSLGSASELNCNSQYLGSDDIPGSISPGNRVSHGTFNTEKICSSDSSSLSTYSTDSSLEYSTFDLRKSSRELKCRPDFIEESRFIISISNLRLTLCRESLVRSTKQFHKMRSDLSTSVTVIEKLMEFNLMGLQFDMLLMEKIEIFSAIQHTKLLVFELPDPTPKVVLRSVTPIARMADLIEGSEAWRPFRPATKTSSGDSSSNVQTKLRFQSYVSSIPPPSEHSSWSTLRSIPAEELFAGRDTISTPAETEPPRLMISERVAAASFPSSLDRPGGQRSTSTLSSLSAEMMPKPSVNRRLGIRGYSYLRNSLRGDGPLSVALAASGIRSQAAWQRRGTGPSSDRLDDRVSDIRGPEFHDQGSLSLDMGPSRRFFTGPSTDFFEEPDSLLRPKEEMPGPRLMQKIPEIVDSDSPSPRTPRIVSQELSRKAGSAEPTISSELSHPILKTMLARRSAFIRARPVFIADRRPHLPSATWISIVVTPAPSPDDEYGEELELVLRHPLAIRLDMAIADVEVNNVPINLKRILTGKESKSPTSIWNRVLS